LDDPDLNEQFPDVPGPDSNPDSSTGRDVPAHQVADGGTTIAMTAAAFAVLFGARRRRRHV
jgi:hypothetical protein